MRAEQINASIAGTSNGAYIFGRTVKDWINRQCRTPFAESMGFYLTSSGETILDGEMYFVNEHGIWLVE